MMMTLTCIYIFFTTQINRCSYTRLPDSSLSQSPAQPQPDVRGRAEIPRCATGDARAADLAVQTELRRRRRSETPEGKPKGETRGGLRHDRCRQIDLS